MAVSRTRIILLAVLAVLLVSAYFSSTIKNDILVLLETPRNVIKVEAAGIHAVVWPDMVVSINGQDIGRQSIDTEQRNMYSYNVPNAIERVSEIKISIPNQSHCKWEATFCDIRKIIVRGLYLNDKKLEDGEPSGKGNTPSLLEAADGGITWHINE